MQEEKCLLDPQRDCLGLKRADEVAGDLKSLDRRLTDFQRSVSETNNRFGGRIGKLEAHNEVQDEQMRQIKETQVEIKREIAEAQKEQKNSIAELRAEHKESMAELRATNKEILEAVTPLKHKVEGLEILTEDVEALKSKPAKTWDEIKSKALGWAVVLVLAIVAAALGLRHHRIIPHKKEKWNEFSQEPRNCPKSRTRSRANQAVRQGLSAKIRFARANTIFNLAVCFRRPRYRVFR